MMNASAPPPGSVIAGKYRVERMLGTGGMAVVVEATHMVLGQRVAIKLLRADAARSPGVIERFRQEAQIAAQLPGDHIVRVTDVGETHTGEAYLVMELLVGRDLEAELLARGWFPMEEAVDTILQACEGVAEAHAVGLVHRDLKPGNLFVMRRRDGSPLIKVLDFGISKLLWRDVSTSLTQTTSNFGTPLYMSPEQIQSVKHVDARCDQHAIGAILYTLLAGRPPFIAPSVTALSVMIATQPPASLREVRGDIPIRLQGAIERSLSKQPYDRFPDLAAFGYAIAPFGGPHAEAMVRRIASALASAQAYPTASSSDPGYMTPQPQRLALGPPSDPGRMSPTATVSVSPPSSDPNAASIHAAGGGMPLGPSGVFQSPVRPPMDPSAVFASPAPRGPVGQTTAVMTTAVSSERAASARRLSLAIVIVSLSAFTVAALVAVALARFGPRSRASEASHPVVSAAATSVSLAAVSASRQWAAPSPAPTPIPAASEAANDPAAPATAEPSAPPAASIAPAAAPSKAAPKPIAAPLATTPARPVAPASKPAPSKKKDPGEVFGAKR